MICRVLSLMGSPTTAATGTVCNEVEAASVASDGTNVDVDVDGGAVGAGREGDVGDGGDGGDRDGGGTSNR